MQILVDADACPVIETVEKIAKEHCVPVTLLCDTNHDLIFDIAFMTDTDQFIIHSICSITNHERRNRFR